MSPDASTSVPIHYVALRGPKGVIDQVDPVDPSNAISYSLCGGGSSCAIATGTPSVARGTLVRREILELALYTFKYVGGIKNVIAFMPPPAGQQASLAVAPSVRQSSPAIMRMSSASRAVARWISARSSCLNCSTQTTVSPYC